MNTNDSILNVLNSVSALTSSSFVNQHFCAMTVIFIITWQTQTIRKLEIRPAERGICPIAKSTVIELFLWPDAFRMHEMAIFPLLLLNLMSPSCSLDRDFL